MVGGLSRRHKSLKWPALSRWFCAILVFSGKIKKAKTLPRVRILITLHLIKATSSNAAYKNAVSWGRRFEAEYSAESHQWKWIGIQELLPVYGKIRDGCEIAFQETYRPRDLIGSLVVKPRDLYAIKRTAISARTSKNAWYFAISVFCFQSATFEGARRALKVWENSYLIKAKHGRAALRRAMKHSREMEKCQCTPEERRRFIGLQALHRIPNPLQDGVMLALYERPGFERELKHLCARKERLGIFRSVAEELEMRKHQRLWSRRCVAPR